jgi:hypothetical protein
MIQSATYELIKQEGIAEGIQQGIQQEQVNSRRKAVCDVLEVHLGLVPLDVMKTLKRIDDAQILEELLRKAVTVNDMQEFRDLLKQVLEPV